MSITVYTSDPLIIKENITKPISNVLLYLDDWTFLQENRSPGITIYVHLEPEAMTNARGFLCKNYERIDYILTFDSVILASCPNARKYIYGNTWILEEDWKHVDIHAKQYKITSFITSKSRTKGHHFRKELYMNQLSISQIPLIFYRGSSVKDTLQEIGNNPLLYSKRSSKIELFKDAEFSLVIENSREHNYFTEKLCDCLITKTIPIYYGAPNISDYFDTTGWIILTSESITELSEKLAILTPEYYMNNLNTCLKNYEIVQKYINLTDNINKGLKQFPCFYY